MVVTTILVVLMAVLAPSLEKAVGEAQRVFCASNEHAAGVGLAAWLADHKRAYPEITNYGTLMGTRGVSKHYGSGERGVGDRPLNKYLGYGGSETSVPVAHCPADAGDSLSYESTDYTPTPNSYTGYGTSYIEAFKFESWAVKPAFGEKGNAEARSARDVNLTRTDNKILLGDWPMYGSRKFTSELTRWHNAAERQMNVLFADSHAEFYLFPAGAMEDPGTSFRHASPDFYWW